MDRSTLGSFVEPLGIFKRFFPRRIDAAGRFFYFIRYGTFLNIEEEEELLIYLAALPKLRDQSNYKLIPAKPVEIPKNTSGQYDRNNPYYAPIKENSELLKNIKPGEIRSTRKVAFDISGAKGLNYNAGDHLGVLPSNRVELVNVC